MSDEPLPQSEIILYQTEDGRTRLQCRFENETVWLTQALIAELFQVTVSTVNEHLKGIYAEGELAAAATIRKFRIVRTEGRREVAREIEHYNLDTILAVGFRVRSHRGTQFRQWAIGRLNEYLVKGFAMDDERLKNPPGQGQKDYFDEQLERIRDIRSSERRFYQKVLDIYATSADYTPNAEMSQQFFATVQNKIHWAAHGQTAAEAPKVEKTETMTRAAKLFPIMPKMRKCKVSKLLAAITLVGALDFIAIASADETNTFRVATYNVENYLDAPTQTRRVKPDLAKAKVRESILALHPDVLALQEIGTISALEELRSALKTGGLDFPYWEHVSGYDTNVHVAVLSRFPFSRVHPHTNDSFLLDGRRFRVSRGFGEVGIQVRTNYSFTLIVTHLKSKRPIPQADEADLRLEEAKVLREKINAVLNSNPSANVVVLGDLNDNKNAPSTKEVIGRGKFKLLDTRPAERNGDELGAGASATGPRNIAWTHYYSVEDTYSRLDYILLSPGMAREWIPKETYVLAEPHWGLGSDHRPVVATFVAEDR